MQLTGWVYILKNPAMRRRLKIGWTSISVAGRARELSRPTGIPEDFVVVWSMPAYAEAVEREAHRRLDRWRTNNRREFFRCSLWRAKLVIWAANRDYWREVLGQGVQLPNPLALFAKPARPAMAVSRPARRSRAGQGGYLGWALRHPERSIPAAAVCLALLVAAERPPLAWMPEGAVKRAALMLERP